jgi:hypothetical protein
VTVEFIEKIVGWYVEYLKRGVRDLQVKRI